MSKVLFSYEDLKALPENGKRYEILEGDFHVSPAPKTIHQTVVVNLTGILSDFVKKHSLGRVFCAPADVVFSSENVVQLDVLFISHANQHILTETHIQGAPDLVVEVFSEGTKEADQTVKKKIYARFGVKHSWMIDPEQKALESFLLTEEGFKKERSCEKNDVITCSLFPGLSFSVSELLEVLGSGPDLTQLHLPAPQPPELIPQRAVFLQPLHHPLVHPGHRTIASAWIGK